MRALHGLLARLRRNVSTTSADSLAVASARDVQPVQPAPPSPGMAAGESADAHALSTSVSEAARSVSLAAWHVSGDAVMGLAHRRGGVPCQDAVAYCGRPRPILALSDGAGSAPASDRGAKVLVVGIRRLLTTFEDDMVAALDHADRVTPAWAERWSEMLRRHAQGLLADLSQQERRDVRDLRATLLVAVIGERHTFWWKVGDGAVVARTASGMRALGNPLETKGEFANQTCFVDGAESRDVQSGLLHTSEVFGIALMSDGGAERLVSSDGAKVAKRLGHWLDSVARQAFSTDSIALAFHEPAMWERTSLDDRSIVLAARQGLHSG